MRRGWRSLVVGVVLAASCSPRSPILLPDGQDAATAGSATADGALPDNPAVDAASTDATTADVTPPDVVVDAGPPPADVVAVVDAGPLLADVPDVLTPVDVVTAMDVVAPMDVVARVDVVAPTDVVAPVDVVARVDTGCASDGDCPSGRACVSGGCVERVCTPGEASCADRLTRRACDARGLTVTTTACPAGALCGGAGLCRTYRDVVLAARPMAYWRFEEAAGPTARDEVGGLVATATGGVSFAQPGLIGSGRALGFRGAQRLDLPYAAALNPAQFSVEVWARVAGSPGVYRSPFTSRFNVPTQGYALYVDDTNRWNLFVGNGAPASWETTSSPDPIVAGRIDHVVATYGARTVRLYVNGELVASRSGVVLLVNGRGGARIGAGLSEYPTVADYYFDGPIDELAVYDRPLTPDEVVEHWTHGTP
ncbi:MAG: hypothetical protein JWM10_4070 [Myxococcaceae bacterium]|nr:hypothetical protein [Myxococcaceae bacterium]